MLSEQIIRQFLEFYYNAINTNNMMALLPHLKAHSTFVRNNTHFKGNDNILNSLSILHSNKLIVPQKMDFLLNGDRRANIMVSGKFDDKPFTEYIHFALGNDKLYWIQMSMLQIIS
jgi:hypothetical protein